LDLLLFRDGRRIGFEIKYVDAPRATKSMRVAISDLQLDALYIVYPGRKSYRIDETVSALSVTELGTAVSQ